MKKRSTLTFVFAFTALFLSLSLRAATTTITNDPELKAVFTMNYEEPVVRVSFDGNDGANAFFRMISKEGVVMVQIDQVELIKSPNYFTVNVTEIPAGTYTVWLKTAAKEYTSTVTIK